MTGTDRELEIVPARQGKAAAGEAITIKAGVEVFYYYHY